MRRIGRFLAWWFKTVMPVLVTVAVASTIAVLLISLYVES